MNDIKLAFGCLGQTSLSRQAHIDIAKRIRQDLEAQTWKPVVDDESLEQQFAVVEARLALLARAS